MNNLPKIKVNEDQLIKIDNLFERLLFQAEDFNTKYPVCWKRTIFELHMISNYKKSPFNKNTSDGIMYLFAMTWHTVCCLCDDDVNKWLFKLAMAWLLREEPPIFVDCTCDTNYY